MVIREKINPNIIIIAIYVFLNLALFVFLPKIHEFPAFKIIH